MRLVLAEKPSVARDIAKALGAGKDGSFFSKGDLIVAHALGHLYEVADDLAPERWSLEGLPIFPERFRYRPLPRAGELLKELRRVLSKATEVVIATDPGREGELIARLILEHLGWRGRTLRLWTAEALTPEVVRREFQKGLRPAEEFDSLYQAALARQHADWLVGINLTRALTLKAPRGGGVWSVGRVQTPTLRLVVEREEAIEAFRPTPYGVVEARFAKGGFRYKGKLLHEGTLSPEEAQAIAEALEGAKEGQVVSLKEEERTLLPPLLHSLTSLQREANARYGFSAKRTLDLAQALYEEHKCISYPRTDSRHLPESARSLVRRVLEKLGREDLAERLPKVGKRVFDDSKLTDHHAIIPLSPPPDGLTPDEAKVYDLVRRRFLAALSEPAKEKRVEAITEVSGRRFRALFRSLAEPGWTQEEAPPKPQEEEEAEEVGRVPLAQGDQVAVEGVRWERRETKPPARYTEGTLLKEMERLGLGTPATRASILENLKERGYLLLSGKSLVPTEKGRALIALLRERRVASPEMTGEWEARLEAIWRERLGEEGYRRFMAGIRSFVQEELEAILSMEVPEVRKTATPKMLAYAKSLARQLGKKLEGDDFDTVKAFIEEAKAQIQEGNGLGTCACGARIVPFSKGWKCEAGHVVWGEMWGKRLTAKQAVALLEGGRIKAEGLKGKSGKPFGATLYYDHGEGRVKLDFERGKGA